MQNDERMIAVFIDFENVAMGVRESNYGNFDIDLVLKRVVEKGKILFKRAYSDWHHYAEFKRAFHQAAIELIDVPQTRYSGKNSADIRMVVDAFDLSYQKDHIDTFVIVSGDSDFSPLVSKLRENGRYVIGVGVKKSSSDLLVNNCDEFVYYEDLFRPGTAAASEEPKLRNLPQKRAEALRLVMDTFQAMQREGKEVIYGSMIKQTLLRKLPSFNESYYGYPMFSRLLEDAQENKLLSLTKDLKSGGYVVTLFGETGMAPSAAAAPTNGDSEVPGVQAATAVPASLVPAPSEPREKSRYSRWGRGRIRGPQRIKEPSQAGRKAQSPVLAGSSVGPPSETVEGVTVPDMTHRAGSTGIDAAIGATVPMETSDSKASESASAETPTEASVQIQTQQSQPGGRGRRSHWERGRRGSRRTPATTPQALVSSPPAGGEAPLPGSASALAATEPGGTLVRHEELPVQFSLGISAPFPQPLAGSGEALSKVQAAEETVSKSKRPRPPSRRSGGKSTSARKPNPRKTPKKP